MELANLDGGSLFLDSLVSNSNDFPSILRSCHQEENFGKNANLSMGVHQQRDIPIDEKDEANVFYFNTELQVHGNDRSATEDCLRRNLDWKTAAQILESVDPGCMKKCSCIASKLDKIERNTAAAWMIYFLARFAKMTTLYLDIYKDIIWFNALLSFVTLSFLLNPANSTTFVNQILFLQLISIVSPLLAVGVKVGLDDFFVIFGHEATKNRRCTPWIGLPLSIVLCPILPALLTGAWEAEIQNIKRLLGKNKITGSNIEAAHQKIMFVKRAKKVNIFFKESELMLEVTIQSTIQILILLATQSNTLTERNLDDAFAKDRSTMSDAWIILSILWTLKTAMSSYLKIQSNKKDGFLKHHSNFQRI